MHLGNGAVTPACAVFGFGVATMGLGVAAWALRLAKVESSRKLAAAVLGAGVFAAQALNVPVLPFASAHLVGGVLLAWVLGPALGAWTMAMVLTLQALLLGDGGLLALGCNIVNMGLLPAGLVLLARRALRHDTQPSRTRQMTWAGLVAAGAVLGAALLIVAEVALGRSGAQLNGLGVFAWQMTWTHALIGVSEGLVTVGLLGLLGQFSAPTAAMPSPTRLYGAGVAALMLLVAALTLSSPMPDGYEWSLEQTALHGQIESLQGFNATVHAWQEAVVGYFPVEWVALTAGTILAGLGIWGLSWMLSSRRSLASLG